MFFIVNNSKFILDGMYKPEIVNYKLLNIMNKSILVSIATYKNIETLNHLSKSIYLC